MEKPFNDMVDIFATLGNTAIKLKSSVFLTPESETKLKDIVWGLIQKIADSVKVLDFSKPIVVAAAPTPQVQVQVTSQPVVQAAPVVVADAPVKTYVGFTLAELNNKDTTTLHNIGCTIVSMPNSSKAFPSLGNGTEAALKESLIRYIVDNAHFRK